jgi:predicted dehydrogenase
MISGQVGLTEAGEAMLEHKIPVKPVTCVIIGAGQRGRVYAGYAEDHPAEWQVVGVADPVELRKGQMAETHGISEENQFADWKAIFDRPKFADVVVISTSDNMHYEPAIAALEKGYDLLLEKPVAQSTEQCLEILRVAEANGCVVTVAHVLRYTPYFRKMKEIIDSGKIGDIVSVQHMEPVGVEHFAQAFVRGNWGNTNHSNPLLLSKSCHDLDILRWLIGKPCERVSSFGSLSHFKKENAPAGAPKRCTDGCPVEESCPHSAFKVCIEKKTYPFVGYLNVEDETNDEMILEKLKTGPYGRCVYHCDNDVVDHQVVNMEFEGGVTVAFSVEALTSYSHRRTRIMGTLGDIVGDGHMLKTSSFVTETEEAWDVRDHMSEEALFGHGGGDHAIVKDLVQAVSQSNPDFLSSTLKVSIESHRMGFKAEESRLNKGQVMELL